MYDKIIKLKIVFLKVKKDYFQESKNDNYELHLLKSSRNYSQPSF